MSRAYQLSSLPPIEEIHMRKDREKALQQKEKEYWEHFAKYIPEVKKNYVLGRAECTIYDSDFLMYKENASYIYWKRLFGDLIFNVQDEHGVVGIKITFGL